MTTEQTIVTPDQVKLVVRADGGEDAPALLCLNSLGTGLELWDAQVPGWSAVHRVLRFDQRGHGRSEAPPGPYHLDELGADAVAVLDAFGVASADLCGVSLGGLVGLWVAIHHPERVRRVVLACTAARVGTRESWEERAAAVRRGGTAAIADLVMARFFSDTFRASDPTTVASCRAALTGTSDTGYAATCLALAAGDLRSRVHEARAPALVIAGSADKATPPDQVRALHDALPQASWLELDGAGHLPNVEQPERFGAAVQRFLADP